MTPVLISVAFGAMSFVLTVAVCIRTMKPRGSLASKREIPDSSATPVAALAIPLRMDIGERFLPVGITSDLRLPTLTLRVERIASLPLGRPLRIAVREFRLRAGVDQENAQKE
jgi:hypothetical protein